MTYFQIYKDYDQKICCCKKETCVVFTLLIFALFVILTGLVTWAVSTYYLSDAICETDYYKKNYYSRQNCMDEVNEWVWAVPIAIIIVGFILLILSILLIITVIGIIVLIPISITYCLCKYFGETRFTNFIDNLGTNRGVTAY